MKKLASLSVFFPCYNDAKIMPYLVARINTILPKIARDYEIIVVNDGSSDDSLKILKLLTKQYRRLKIVNHKKNRGYGGALISGFKKAKKEWVFYTDGDGQYDTDEITQLIYALTKNTDVVNGYKSSRNDHVMRRLLGGSYNLILQKIYQLPISDIDCDFRLIRRSLVSKLDLTSQSGTICLELIYKLKNAGAHFKEVPVSHLERTFGASQFFRLHHLMNTFKDHVQFYKEYKLKLPQKLSSRPYRSTIMADRL